MSMMRRLQLSHKSPSNCGCCQHEVHRRIGCVQLMAKYIATRAKKRFIMREDNCVGIVPFSNVPEKSTV